MTARSTVLVVALWAATAQAHKPSDSYLVLRSDGATLTAQWDIALRDIDYAIGLDTDRDGEITWGELRARSDAVAAYALARFQVEGDGQVCPSRLTEQLVDYHSDGAYAVLRFMVDCPHASRTLELRYTLFFDLDPQHRGLLHFTSGGATRALLFSADQTVQRLEVAATGSWQSLREYWFDGVWHGWASVDYGMFLLALLLPGVLRREAGRWRVVVDGRRPLADAARIVTAFTLACSLTLSVAVLGAIQFPAGLLGPAIAASVVVAALNNAWPIFHERRWLIGFAFGLLHGFGFARVLIGSGMARGSVALALLGFNAGIGTGELALVSAFLMLAYAARRAWMVERVPLMRIAREGTPGYR